MISFNKDSERDLENYSLSIFTGNIKKISEYSEQIKSAKVNVPKKGGSAPVPLEVFFNDEAKKCYIHKSKYELNKNALSVLFTAAN